MLWDAASLMYQHLLSRAVELRGQGPLVPWSPPALSQEQPGDAP